MIHRLGAVWLCLPSPLRATLTYALGIAWARGLSMVMIPLVTALMAPAEFGRLEILSSAAEIGALVVSAGILETLFRFASPHDAAGRAAGSAVVGLACAAGVLALAVLLPMASTIAGALPLGASTTEVMLLSLSISLEAILVVTMAWIRLEGRAGLYVGVTIARATLQSLLVAFLVLHGWGVAGILAGGAVVACGSAAALLVRQWRITGISAAPRHWGGYLSYSLPLIGSGLACFAMGTADRWILAPSVGAGDLGRYALAAKIALASSSLMQPFELWWYPRRMAILKTPDGLERSAKATDAGISLAIVSATATSAIGPALIRALTPVAYHPACTWVPWLAAAMSLQAIGSLCNVGAYAGRTGNLPMAINATAAAVAIGGYLALIPSMGVTGAVAATVAAQAARLILILPLSLNRVRVPHRGRPLSALALAGIAAGALPAALMENGLTATVVGLVGTTGVVAMATVMGLFPVPHRLLFWKRRNA